MASIQHNALHIPLPSGWDDGSQVVALGPVDGGFRPNFVASREPAKPGESPDKYAARVLPALKGSLQGYAVVKEGAATFGKNAGFQREHTFTANGQKIGQVQLYLVVGAQAHTLTFTHLAPKLAGARKLAEQLFAETKLG
jgi:hypothetical protein